MNNITNPEYQIPVFYESPYSLYKKQKNKETTKYIINNLQNAGLYNEKTNNLLFNLSKIGKIKNIYNNLQNKINNNNNNDSNNDNKNNDNKNNDNKNNDSNDNDNKNNDNAFLFNKIKNIKQHIKQHNKLYNSLEYTIHKNKTLVMLEKIFLLLLNKGYTYDFNNYDYILYEKNTSIPNQRINNNINNINDIPKYLYFIKIKYKKNIIIDNKYNNEFEITKIIFIFHNEMMFEYFI